MDSIYDDLENYNNVNEVEELRVKNNELKLKIEEYSANIERLQNDYDKLSSDFKNLETNFSSLLKTAKAEIERKTQAIALLNQEKDMLVISSIQNSNMGYSVLTRNFSNNRKSRIEDTSSAKNNRIEELKKHEPDKKRNDENRQPSTETTSSRNSGEIEKIDKIEVKSKIDGNDQTNESKEGSGKAKKALSLKNRRKSMPVLNKQQLSSDEEYEGNCSEEIPRRDWSKEDKRRYSERNKQNHKISETSGIDEKYSSYHESSRETYFKNKLCKQSDKQRPRDRSRQKRHLSPQRIRIATRDYHDDPRQEFMRYRVLISPPKDSYSSRRFKGRQKMERESSHEERLEGDYHDRRYMPRDDYRDERQRNNYEKRPRSDSREDLRVSLLDKRRNRNLSPEYRYRKRRKSEEEKHGQRNKSHEDRRRKRDNSLEGRLKRANEKLSKGKVSSDIEEPSCKRPRLDSETSPADLVNALPEIMPLAERIPANLLNSKPEETFTDVVNMRPENTEETKNTTAERMPSVQDNLPHEFGVHLQQSSCQSPDNIQSDVAATLPKTIQSTLCTEVEDPRLTSKKYVKGIEGTQVVLTTKTGRDVELKAIDWSTWNIPSVEVPQALTKPPQGPVRNVQELYMDIGNPVSNISLESGEIQSESNDTKMMEYVSKNFFQDYENERINLIDARAENRHRRDPRFDRDMPKANNVQDQSNKEETLGIERKHPPVICKIPRTSISDPKPITASHPLEILLKQLKSIGGVEATTKLPVAKLDVDETFGPDNDTENKAQDEENKPKKARQLRERRKVSTTEIVENDLALSDEPSDKVITRSRKRLRKGEKNLKDQALEDEETVNKNSGPKEIAKEISVEVNDKESEKTLHEVSHQMKSVSSQTADETPEVQLYAKRSKKAKQKVTPKSKATVVKESQKPANIAEISEKKTRERKSPKETDQNAGKLKFSDLFGDSSSLITPEDLGMAPQSQPKNIVEKYIPIFEDAQDSVDVNVNAGKQKETQLLIEKPPVTSNIDESTPRAVSTERTKSLLTKIVLPKSSPMLAPTKKDQSASEVIQKFTPNMEVSDTVFTKEPDSIKTVIISTGIQAQVDDIQIQNSKADIGINVDKTAATNFLHIPAALATSTPHKRLLIQLEGEAPSSSTSSQNTSSVNQSPMSNGLSSETQNYEAPDIRLVNVKRRRRPKKSTV